MSDYGRPFEIIYVSDSARQPSSSQLQFTSLKRFTSVRILPSDILIVPGYDLRRAPPRESRIFFHWLQQADIGAVTEQCGLQSTNQLRHIIRKHTSSLPSALGGR